MSKPKKFIKRYVKKSYNFEVAAEPVSPVDQQAAEETSSSRLLEWFKNNFEYRDPNDPIECELGTSGCKINLHKIETGLYTGFFSDHEGQVVSKFHGQTLAEIVKTLELKHLIYDDMLGPPPEVCEAVPTPPEPEEVKGTTLKIKFGDFELELKKSIHDFVNDYKKSQAEDKMDISKAIKSWRRNMAKSIHFQSDAEAARELLKNWDSHQESFNQILFVMKQMAK